MLLYALGGRGTIDTIQRYSQSPFSLIKCTKLGYTIHQVVNPSLVITVLLRLPSPLILGSNASFDQSGFYSAPM